MKDKKQLIYTSIFIAFSVLAITNMAVFVFNHTLAIINFLIVCIIFGAGFVFIKYFYEYIFNISTKTKKFIDENSDNLINFSPIPIAILEKSDSADITFYNNAFENHFIKDKSQTENILNSFSKKIASKNNLSKNHFNMCFNNEKFKVYIKNFETFFVLYFLDITAYKTLENKFENSKPCVGIAVFDNKEELREESTDKQISEISLAVENSIQEWINSVDGIFKKLSNGKFFIIFEKVYLKKFIDEKFKIIDEIHSIKLNDSKYATVSIGISAQENSLINLKNEAQKALNMALGRGGDQVSIRENNSYVFFGGNSQSIEKRSKVKTRIIATSFSERIKNSSKIFIMGHKHSDFDSVGSAVGIWNICSKLKKDKSYIVINEETSLAKSAINHIKTHYKNKEIFISTRKAQELIDENSLLIIVDTHSLKFLESSDLYSMSKQTMIIDHHRLTVDKIDNTVIFFHEPFASSTCEMVTELSQYMGENLIDKPVSECLFAGIMLDTKNFSLKAGTRTFEAASYLKKSGADNFEVKKMFSNSMDVYKLKCQIIEAAYDLNSCAISALKFDKITDNVRLACAQAADELLNIKNIEASFVIFSENDRVNISARSLGKINVQLIMEKLGGGGHRTMAATQIDNASIEEVKKNLTLAINEKINELKGGK